MTGNDNLYLLGRHNIENRLGTLMACTAIQKENRHHRDDV